MGRIFALGIGPGNISNMTAHAVFVIGICDVICGYDRYVDLLGDMITEKQVVKTGMRKEAERCREAIRLAGEGHQVAVICSGDPGVYGMAGLLLEMLRDRDDIGFEVVPGITAATSGAAVLGAPLMNDFAVISLSDQLTPWDKIEHRLRCIAESDMTIVIYNPMSHHRPDTLKNACDTLLKYRDADTVCGWVRNIGRDGQESEITDLGRLKETELDMLCTVFIGSKDTTLTDGRMVTIRGYEV
ncbi:MAG: precorrin-3B C(17)-methyltransferase [Lachnospiraceae bacterium]|nr:precorrin-3B C(17)-methyltransferase [Lachnospiraceae bacterium]